MESIISTLFAARDAAHVLHLRTRSFAAHLALGDLYDALVDLADTLAEGYQGKYGLLQLCCPTEDLSQLDALTFIRTLAAWAEAARVQFDPEDSYLINEWDAVLLTIYRAKYKLENLA